jgi:YD repeat-containing protein
MLIALKNTVCSYGQGDFGHVTPHTADFIKYGNIPVALFIGRMNLEVPVYRIKDLDFDIPISLLYTADGFKPEKRSDFVGFDWTLIAGGCITREVYGTPDEYVPTNWGSNELGFWNFVKEKGNVKNEVWNFSYPVVIPHSYNYIVNQSTSEPGHWVDYQPDLFLFNFNGHSGQFMINNSGMAQSNDNGYKVDLSCFSKQYPHDDQPNISTLRITTPDGYIYEFGGTLDAIEYSVFYREGYKFEELNPTILAWHLTKITAPNGRTVKYKYVTADNLSDSSSPIWQAGRGYYKKHDGNSGPGDIFVNATKKVVLECIEIDQLKIEFKKSKETTLGNNGYFFVAQPTCNRATYQLDTILVKYADNTQYTHVLTYENVLKRRFLSSVTQLKYGQKYNFEYNHGDYPIKMSAVADGLIHGEERDDFGYWTSNNADSSFGLMSKIIYPTGGYSLFTYEKHQYGYAVETKIDDLTKYLVTSSNADTVTVSSDAKGEGFKPITDSDDDLLLPNLPPHSGNNSQKVIKYNIHGARLKSITNFDSSVSESTKKEYIYTDKIKNGSSSGILYQTHPYYIHITGKKVYIIEDSWNRNYNIDEPPIGYSSVIEKYNDGSFIQYKFSDYKTNPDDNYTKMKMLNPAKELTLSDYKLLVATSVNRVSSNSTSRGLLTGKIMYDNKDSEKQKESFFYRYVAPSGEMMTIDEAALINNCAPNVACDDTSYIVSFRTITGGGLAKKIYLKSHPLVIKKVKTDDITTTENFLYNSNNQIKTKRTIVNSQDTLQITYTHPSDYNVSPYTDMTAYNRVSPVIEQTTTRIKGRVRTEMECIYTDYQLWNKLAVPQKTSTKYIGTNNWYTEVTYNSYNNLGRLLQRTGNEDTHTTYLWGYNHQYPIAEIKNATYLEITQYINETALNSIAGKAELTSADSITINNIRNQLPNAYVTTYIYKPLVGMTSKTDPDGVKTTYEYDAFGRLQYVKDENSNVIENYEYNYKQ